MTTMHSQSRPDRTAQSARDGRPRGSRGGSWLLTALMIAVPALAVTSSAGARDEPKKIQERQATRIQQVQQSKPSPPPRRSSPPPTTSSAPPQTSSPPPSTSSAPPQTSTSTPRRSSPPATTSSGRDYRGDYRPDTPVRTQQDDDSRRHRRTPWTYTTGDDRNYRGERDRDSRAHRGDRDVHRDRNHRDHRGYRGHRHHRYCGHSWGAHGYGYGYGYRYNPWYWPWFPSIYIERDGYRSANDGWGALDLDVRPEESEIYLDGQYIGIADEYDGFPSYLWLEEGTYDLAIYHEGYETIFRQVSIYPGIVIDVENSMRSGQAVHPDDYGPSSTARRDARIERNREKEAYARELEAREGASESWSDDDPAIPSGADIGRLYVSVLPPDAAVYLDGHFLGTAGELGQLSAGLVLEPGDHVVELVRPGYDTHREEIVVPPGERVTLETELERD